MKLLRRIFKGKVLPEDAPDPVREPDPVVPVDSDPELGSLPVTGPLTDEGVMFAWMTPEILVNRDQRFLNLRRRELHLGGVPYAHAGETPDGRWLYRHDH